MAFALPRKWSRSTCAFLKSTLAPRTRRLASTKRQTATPLFTELTAGDITPTVNHPIAGRPFLPGSKGKGLPKYLPKPRANFPHAIMATNAGQLSIPQWSEACRQQMEVVLPKYGSLLMRGLPVHSVADFSEFSSYLGWQSMSYIGGNANRLNVQADVYTANEETAEHTIELHNEMAYHETYPSKIMFFCLQKPIDTTGGSTAICDGAEFLRRLDPDVAEKLEKKKIRYINRVPCESRALPRSCTWQTVFDTKDKKEVERYLTKQGCGYSWDSKLNSLSYWRVRPAFINHPDTREKYWFNQVTAAHISAIQALPQYPGDDKLDQINVFDTTYGDGSEVEPEVIEHIRACMWHSSVGFQWLNGDVLILDNFKMLHTRLGYSGERAIMVRLFA